MPSSDRCSLCMRTIREGSLSVPFLPCNICQTCFDTRVYKCEDCMSALMKFLRTLISLKLINTSFRNPTETAFVSCFSDTNKEKWERSFPLEQTQMFRTLFFKTIVLPHAKFQQRFFSNFFFKAIFVRSCDVCNNMYSRAVQVSCCSKCQKKSCARCPNFKICKACRRIHCFSCLAVCIDCKHTVCERDSITCFQCGTIQCRNCSQSIACDRCFQSFCSECQDSFHVSPNCPWTNFCRQCFAESEDDGFFLYFVCLIFF